MTDDLYPVEQTSTELQAIEPQPAELQSLPPPAELTGAARVLGYVLLPPVVVWQTLRMIFREAIPGLFRVVWPPLRAVGLAAVRGLGAAAALARDLLRRVGAGPVFLWRWFGRAVVLPSMAALRLLLRAAKAILTRFTVVARTLGRAVEVASRRIGSVCVQLVRRAPAILREAARACLRAVRLVWVSTRAIAVRTLVACRVPARAFVLALSALVHGVARVARRIWAGFRPLLAAALRQLAQPFRWAARATHALTGYVAAAVRTLAPILRHLGAAVAAIGALIRAGGRRVSAVVAVLGHGVGSAFAWAGRNLVLAFRLALRPFLSVARSARALLAVVLESARGVIGSVEAYAAAGLARLAGALQSVGVALLPLARLPLVAAARLARALSGTAVRCWQAAAAQARSIAGRIGVTLAEVRHAVRAARESAALAVREARARRRA